MALKVSDLRAGDLVRVRWYPGHPGLVGVVEFVLPAASRASGTHIRTAAGQAVRIKSSMEIERI